MWKKGPGEGDILGYKNASAFTAASIQNTLYFLNIYIFPCNAAPPLPPSLTIGPFEWCLATYILLFSAMKEKKLDSRETGCLMQLA